MKASELARRVGVSRQWLSKWAQGACVPNAVRQANGRWRYEDTPELKKWIKYAAARTAAWKRRVLSKGVRETVRLRRHLKKPGTTAAKVRKLQARLEELAAKPAYWTVQDVAKQTGWSVRSIQRKAKDVPGATFISGQFRFPRTADFAEWLYIERGRYQTRRRAMRSDDTLPRNFIGDYIRRVRALPEKLMWDVRGAFFREIAKTPLQQWTMEELQYLLNEVETNAGAMCRKLRAEIEARGSSGVLS